jgi:tetratricopeptide (TPR) repeat protein
MADEVGVTNKRIKQLCSLAKAYRGINQEQLAQRLGRHPDRLAPGNGNPKLDYLLALSRVLDWPVSLIVSFIEGETPDDAHEAAGTERGDFAALESASRQCHIEGRYDDAVTLAQRAFAVAQTPDEHVIACIREASGNDGLGRYAEALAAEQRGLAETPASGELRRQLESNLANGYYTLWALPEAESVSLKLISWYRRHPATSYKDRVTDAFALYVYGNTLRRMAAMGPDQSEVAARDAETALKKSRRLYVKIGREFKQDWCDGIANTITGALIHVAVLLGERDPREALKEIETELELVTDPTDPLVGDSLESRAWWCIFGCCIAQEYLSDETLLQHYMAMFTDKADVIARRLDNWALRERVFAMEYASYERVERLTGRAALLTLDADDLEALVGVMGRFPRFGPTGMKLFEAHAATMKLAV